MIFLKLLSTSQEKLFWALMWQNRNLSQNYMGIDRKRYFVRTKDLCSDIGSLSSMLTKGLVPLTGHPALSWQAISCHKQWGGFWEAVSPQLSESRRRENKRPMMCRPSSLWNQRKSSSPAYYTGGYISYMDKDPTIKMSTPVWWLSHWEGHRSFCLFSDFSLCTI